MARKGTKKVQETHIRQFLQLRSIDDFGAALDAAEPRPGEDADRDVKRNYAQRLSEASAVLIANALRPAFPQVLPHTDGTGQESRARTGKGIKKLDVNYSTPELGLGCGVSIKTLNFRDPKTRRYTKNPTRLDNELRAESMDYHERQPYSVLVGVVLVPADACDDGDEARPKRSWSSFAQIVNVLRHRAGREGARDDNQLFEKIYVGLYRYGGAERGEVAYFDVDQPPPQFGRPAAGSLLDFDQVISKIVEVYDGRNLVKPAWETNPTQDLRTLQDLLESEVIPSEDEDEDEDGA